MADFNPDSFPMPPRGCVFIVAESNVQLMRLESVDVSMDKYRESTLGYDFPKYREPEPMNLVIRGLVRHDDNRRRTPLAVPVGVTVVEASTHKQLGAPARALRGRRDDDG